MTSLILRHSQACPAGARDGAGQSRSRPDGWSTDLDRRLLKAIRSGRVTPAILADFRADGWSSAQVLDRSRALLAGEGIDPLSRALALLGPRVAPAALFRRDGFDYALDGRKADAAALVREANRGLANLGLAPIRWPGISADGAAGPAGPSYQGRRMGP